ncbi:hypothetical protein V5O48_009963 [Marasmius crinis-equi]|uniref:Uncharacterized protein n=1 Tax=Marasmius crinis-equi TaxID=585013 RepID=A0ABR3F9P5_9AGAR
MTHYPDSPYTVHLQPDCNGGEGCADNAGCALHPFALLLNITRGSLVFTGVEQEATFALGAKFCPEVMLYVQCSQREKHEIEFQTNWEEGGEDLIMNRTDWLDVHCECPERLYAWDWKATNCIVSGVRAYMEYRKPEVEDAERMAEAESSWSDIERSSEDESTDTDATAHCTSDSTKSSDDETSDSSSDSSESCAEPPRKRRRTSAAATAVVGSPARAPPAAPAQTAAPATRVREYIEELDDGSWREYVELLSTQ